MDSQVEFCRETRLCDDRHGQKALCQGDTGVGIHGETGGRKAGYEHSDTGKCCGYHKACHDQGATMRIRKNGLKSRLILQIHDELIINAYDDERDVVGEAP